MSDRNKIDLEFSSEHLFGRAGRIQRSKGSALFRVSTNVCGIGSSVLHQGTFRRLGNTPLLPVKVVESDKMSADSAKVESEMKQTTHRSNRENHEKEKKDARFESKLSELTLDCSAAIARLAALPVATAQYILAQVASPPRLLDRDSDRFARNLIFLNAGGMEQKEERNRAFLPLGFHWGQDQSSNREPWSRSPYAPLPQQIASDLSAEPREGRNGAFLSFGFHWEQDRNSNRELGNPFPYAPLLQEIKKDLFSSGTLSDRLSFTPLATQDKLALLPIQKIDRSPMFAAVHNHPFFQRAGMQVRFDRSGPRRLLFVNSGEEVLQPGCALAKESKKCPIFQDPLQAVRLDSSYLFPLGALIHCRAFFRSDALPIKMSSLFETEKNKSGELSLRSILEASFQDESARLQNLSIPSLGQPFARDDPPRKQVPPIPLLDDNIISETRLAPHPCNSLNAVETFPILDRAKVCSDHSARLQKTEDIERRFVHKADVFLPNPKLLALDQAIRALTLPMQSAKCKDAFWLTLGVEPPSIRNMCLSHRQFMQMSDRNPFPTLSSMVNQMMDFALFTVARVDHPMIANGNRSSIQAGQQDTVVAPSLGTEEQVAEFTAILYETPQIIENYFSRDRLFPFSHFS